MIRATLTAAAACADVETASAGYARRFSGHLGAWMLALQTKLITEALTRCGCHAGDSLLDVGGGHDQIARPLELLGYRVSVSVSSLTATEMIAQREHAGDLAVCSLLSHPFGGACFKAVTCIRLLTHFPEWRGLIAEMCRLAQRAVVIDYPPLLSSNVLYPVLFRIKRRLEGDTRTFSLFHHREIEREFKRHGFSLRFRSGQFLLPMVVHRMIKNPGLSKLLETPGSLLGLSRIAGSPVIACFERSEAQLQ